MESKTRTLTQNKSLHVYFRLLAEALNDAGYNIRQTLKDDFNIPWTEFTVKELLAKPVIKAYLGKDSTTELTTDEVDEVYDVLNQNLGEKTGVFVPFPSNEETMLNQLSQKDVRY